MGKNRICVICLRQETNRPGFFANFPLDENRCKEWVRVIGKEDLVYLPIEKLHQIKFVCEDHFAKKDFNKKGSRLLKRAIPKLKLTAEPLPDELLEEFPLHMAKKSGANTNLPGTSTSNQPGSWPTNVDLVPMEIDESQKEQTILQLKLTAEPLPDEFLEGFPLHVARKTGANTDVLGASTSKQPKGTTSADFASKRIEETSGRAQQRTEKKIAEDNIDISPRKKKLIVQLQKTKSTLASLKKSAKLIDKINSPILKNFIAAELKNQNKKSKGRRWTLKEKISALAIFKRSPKTYRYLANGLMLPSIKTLHNLLKKIPMETGINKAVLQHLQKISPTMDEKNKCCVLLFDEIALKPRLLYNEATDEVDGYEDKGKMAEPGRTDRVADHALVFMVQGLYLRYKQLIAYYFVKGTISSQQLSVYIKQIIKSINDAGFRVLSTVCDQGPTNMGALKLLKEYSQTIKSDRFSGNTVDRNYFITEGNKKIYIMYDIPHLFKSIRNNFMSHGQIQMENITGKWCHLFEVEDKNKSLLHLSKITSTHVQPKYRAKMKVKYAAQALSNTVSAVLKLMSQAECDHNRKNDLMQTALVIEQLDRLFDCTNGPSCKEDIKRGQRQNVSAKTNHPQMWNDFKKKLSKIKFIKNDGTEAKNVKCIQGMLTSLSTLQDLWNDLSKLGFRYLNLRSLNQDGLENFFGIIRQHSPTNRNPTCTGFIAALKTSVVSGMTAPHSKGSNCEKDNRKLLTNFEDILEAETQESDLLATKDSMDLKGVQTQLNCEKDNRKLLTDFEDILEAETQESDLLATKDSMDLKGVQTQLSCKTSVLGDEIPVLHIPEEFEIDLETDLSDTKFQPLVYVCGYLASTLKISDCALCRSNLTEENEMKQNAEVYQYIQLREWWDDKRSLTYPSMPLCRMLETAVNVFQKEIIPRLHEHNISALCTTLFVANCDTSWFTCTHSNSMLNSLFVRLGRLLTRRQCHRINQKFVESEERIKDITKKAEQGLS